MYIVSFKARDLTVYTNDWQLYPFALELVIFSCCKVMKHTTSSVSPCRDRRYTKTCKRKCSLCRLTKFRNECCFRPQFCTCKAILGRGPVGKRKKSYHSFHLITYAITKGQCSLWASFTNLLSRSLLSLIQGSAIDIYFISIKIHRSHRVAWIP